LIENIHEAFNGLEKEEKGQTIYIYIYIILCENLIEAVSRPKREKNEKKKILLHLSLSNEFKCSPTFVSNKTS